MTENQIFDKVAELIALQMGIDASGGSEDSGSPQN